MKSRRVAAVGLIITVTIIALLIIFGDRIKRVFIPPLEPEERERTVIYWAHGNLDPDDNIPQKDSNLYFGWNRYRGGKEAVKAGTVKTVADFIATKDGEGDFFYSMECDPSLTAAIALYLDQLGLTGKTPILEPEKDLAVEDRADAAHLRFLADIPAWDSALARIKEILTGENATIEVKQLSGYTSAMYMVPNGLDGDKPHVVVRNTNNEGGHFIVFHVDGKDVRFRLECGYQPIDVPRYKPTPTPAPKDPADDPQNNPDASQYDFYSPDRINHDPDTTETDEPISPDEDYVAPTPPVHVITPVPETPTDYGDGDTEIIGGKPYEVETGDVDSLPPLEEIADPDNPDKPDVDPALAGDGINTGTVVPPE